MEIYFFSMCHVKFLFGVGRMLMQHHSGIWCTRSSTVFETRKTKPETYFLSKIFYIFFIPCSGQNIKVYQNGCYQQIKSWCKIMLYICKRWVKCKMQGTTSVNPVAQLKHREQSSEGMAKHRHNPWMLGWKLLANQKKLLYSKFLTRTSLFPLWLYGSFHL